MTTTKPKAADALDFFDSLAEAQGSDDRPTLTDESLADLVKQYRDASTKAESYATLAGQAKEQLSMAAGRFLFEQSGQARKVISTVGVSAGGMTLAYGIQNRYSKVEGKDVGKLATVLGDRWDEYFVKEMEIKVNPKSISPAFKDELRKLLGDDFLSKHFKAGYSYKVSERFHHAYVTDEAFRRMVRPLVDQEVIKPAAGSLKLA